MKRASHSQSDGTWENRSDLESMWKDEWNSKSDEEKATFLEYLDERKKENAFAELCEMIAPPVEEPVVAPEPQHRQRQVTLAA